MLLQDVHPKIKSRLGVATLRYYTHKNGFVAIKFYGYSKLTDKLETTVARLQMCQNELINFLMIQSMPDIRQCMVPFAGARTILSPQGNQYYYGIASKWAEGGDLFDFLKKHPNLSFYKRVMYIYRLTLLLSELENKGFSYLDVSIENIFLMKKDDPRSMRLGDLESLCFKKTVSGLHTGKIHTISPEQILDIELEHTARSLMAFQLGCCMYVILTNRRRHFAIELISPKTNRRDLSDIHVSLHEIILGLLQYSPSTRWSIHRSAHFLWNLCCDLKSNKNNTNTVTQSIPKYYSC
jgi:serine/threonine protein kinase